MGLEKWDGRFLRLAKEVALWSKDPSTQTGAVLVDERRRLVSVGFNGFPHKIKDDERLQDRRLKYEIILHAEINALIVAARPLVHHTLYLYPYLSCSRCTVVMIQAEIAKVVAPSLADDKKERWETNLLLSERLYEEAGIEVLKTGTV
jgi:dCMP deaminase